MGILLANSGLIFLEIGFLASIYRTSIAGFDTQPIVNQLRESHVAGVLVDATQHDFPIIECNQAFTNLTGYSKLEIVGQNCRFLSRGQADPAIRARFREAIAEGKSAIIEVLNFRKDGTDFLNGVTVAPVTNPDGRVVAFLGSQMDLGTSIPAAPGSAKAAEGELLDNLTARQREAVIYMASGLPIKQIARELGLSERTVKLHRTRAMRALGVDNRIDAVRIALGAGF